MPLVTAFLAGLVFGIGLIVSGMTNPAKVLGFLDVAGRWDPSLLCVMGGAIAVGTVAFHRAARRRLSLLGEPMRLPQAGEIDRRLVLGAVTFGIGWGLAGYCPGPALASVLTGGLKPVIFVAAMVAGMVLFELLEVLQRRRGD